ncbi:YCF48-related protein [uncultured Ramlibacter sp.]|uniref:WD40/YVTN/BNR-like repeat-containing protein n=1 Tax=uncultured Ramlibacter sp. TaxID=260755 RepID=UPI00261C4DE8|nr:YCF48-related protein [uncultured Ramlibacter sp.]
MKVSHIGLLLVAGAALAGPGGAAAVRDVLDTPAQATRLADRAPLLALAAAGARTVAVGQRGHILTSGDGGRSWQQAKVPVSSDLVALHFPTPRKGWAVGHDGVILHSADGGDNWARQRDGRPDAADVPLLDVWFQDERVGYAVGAFGLALRTEDGGARWTSLKDSIANPKGLHLYAVRGIGSDVFMVGEQGLLLRLDRASGQFQAVPQPYQGTLFGIAGNGRALIVHGLRGTVLRSTDGGETWRAVTTGVAASITASTVDPGGRILLASQSGQLLASRDDGASFQVLPLARPVPAAGILLAAPGQLLVAGPRGVQTQALP